MKGLLSPSLMCVDLMNVQESVRALEAAGVDFLHVDIMDNHFVPNITLCPDFIRQLKGITALPLDVHLMVERPEESLHHYRTLDGSDILTVHYEATVHVQRTLTAVRELGTRVGLALNPATPLSALDYLTEDVDMVLVMTVNPGFAGQQLVPATLGKIRRLRDYLRARGREDVLIGVDGNVSFENAAKMRREGADLFVGGSSSVFHPEAGLAENCERLREIVSAERGRAAAM